MKADERIRLLLMADYLADPMWTLTESWPYGVMISLDELPLSAELKSRLRAWAARFDALMTTDYEWPSRAEESAWGAEGRALLPLVRDELGPGYDVRYLDPGYQDPDE